MSRTLTRNNVLVFTETLQSAAAATGNGTAFECLGFGALVAQVTGTFSGTVTFEGTVDGTNYIAIRGMNKNTGTSASTATTAGIFQFSVAGLKYFRARVSAYSSGSITVTATISPESEPALPAASTTAATVAIDQTTSGTTNKVVSTGASAHDAAASGNPVQVGGVYRLADPALADGDAGSIRLNAKGEPIVQLSGSKALETTHQNAVTGGGVGTAANVTGHGSVTFEVSGTFSATINFEGSIDSANYYPIPVFDTSGNRITTTTATGLYHTGISGLKYIRARISGFAVGSGNATVKSVALPIAIPRDTSVQLSGSKEELKKILTSQAGTVGNTTGTETVTVLADSGKIVEIYHVGVYIPLIGGATGNHSLAIYYQDQNFQTKIVAFTCAATQAIKVENGIPYGTYSTIEPTTDLAAIAQLLKNLRLTSTEGIIFYYSNLSNTDQAGGRKYLVNTIQRGA